MHVLLGVKSEIEPGFRVMHDVPRKCQHIRYPERIKLLRVQFNKFAMLVIIQSTTNPANERDNDKKKFRNSFENNKTMIQIHINATKTCLKHIKVM